MEQDNTDILDTQISKPSKKLWTIRLLIFGGGVIAVVFIIASFWDALGLTRKESIWLALSLMVSFGINVAGFIIGIVERKRNPKRALVGILGNLLLMLFFISIIVYSLSLMPELQ